MFGPTEGRRHDDFLLNMSKLDQHMQLLPPDAYVYGDQVYPVRPWLLSPFKGPNRNTTSHSSDYAHLSLHTRHVQTFKSSTMSFSIEVFFASV